MNKQSSCLSPKKHFANEAVVSLNTLIKLKTRYKLHYLSEYERAEMHILRFKPQSFHQQFQIKKIKERL